MSPLPNITVRLFRSDTTKCDSATKIQLTQSCELYFRSGTYAAFLMAEMRLGTTLLLKEPSSHTPPSSKAPRAPRGSTHALQKMSRYPGLQKANGFEWLL